METFPYLRPSTCRRELLRNRPGHCSSDDVVPLDRLFLNSFKRRKFNIGHLSRRDLPGHAFSRVLFAPNLITNMCVCCSLRAQGRGLDIFSHGDVSNMPSLSHWAVHVSGELITRRQDESQKA